MSNRAKEKSQNRNTKDKDILDLDNEIIIGIKSLPKVPKTKKSQLKEKKKGSTKNSPKSSKNTKKKVVSKNSKPKETVKKNVKKKKVPNDDVELRLGNRCLHQSITLLGLSILLV